MRKKIIAVSFGGGTNSTALLIGMRDRGIRPDYITFADTGAEKPHTYRHIDVVNDWLADNDMPQIVTVKKGGNGETLEQDCLRRGSLPSVAYGFKTCSIRFKGDPQNKLYNNTHAMRELWRLGGRVTKYIGFDCDEPQRAKNYDDKKYTVEYPLIKWGWGRDECVKAIKRAGLPQPGKSACFFCPSSKASEIREMAAIYPDLMERALKIEANADLTRIKGLGRNFAWKDLIATDDMFADSYIDIDCGCYDG